MNGEAAKAMRKMKSEAVQEVQPALARVTEYAKTVESRVDQLRFIAQQHRGEIDVLMKSVKTLQEIEIDLGNRTFWGRMKWLILGR